MQHLARAAHAAHAARASHPAHAARASHLGHAARASHLARAARASHASHAARASHAAHVGHAAALSAAVLGAIALAGCDRSLEQPVEGGSGGGGGESVATWTVPACDPVAVIDGVAVHDVGFEARQIVALDEPNVLLAESYGALQRSTDGGCTWEVIDEPSYGHGYEGIVARPGGGAYAYRSSEEGSGLVHIDGDVVTFVGPLPAPASGCCRVGHFLVHPGAPDQLTGFDADHIVRSVDGGLRWTDVGPLPGSGFSALAVDARGPDRFVLAGADGAWTTTDGGASFSAATFEADGEVVKGIASRLVRSAAAPDVVLAMVHGDPPYAGAEADPAVRAGTYRSTDGGATFVRIGDAIRGSFVANPAAVDDHWVSREIYADEWMLPALGVELSHLVDGVERARVEIPDVTRVLAVSPARALYVARVSQAM